MRRLLILAALLLASCSGKREEFLIVYDPCEPLVLAPAEGTEQQIASVSDAIDMWNQVSAVRLTLEDRPDAPRLPIVFEESYLYMGFFDDRNEVIRLATRVNVQRAMAVVLAHELGHAFNLKHVDDRDSVMNEGNTEVAPLASDVAALEAEWGPCVYR